MEIKIFVSYSHRDTQYLDKNELLGFLEGLSRDGDVKFWVDRHLAGGDRWDDEIRTQINEAHIALVLVSQPFLDSHYCMDVEISNFLARRRAEGLKVFPVVLSACEWERHPWLAEHQALPGGDETIEEHYTDAGKRKRLYLKIRKDLRALIDDVRQNLLPSQEPENVSADGLAERRRVTVMACALSIDPGDEVLDEADKIELLYESVPLFRERFIAHIQAADGHVISVNSLGGCIACFGYPNVHEDDTLRAVRTSLSLLATLQLLSEAFEAQMGFKLAVRIGIQTGLIISSTATTTDEAIQHGEASATAALLQDRAPLNSIVLSDSTYKLMHRYFSAEAILEFDLPGSRTRSKGWRIQEDLGIQSRFDAERLSGLTSMVGREAELKLVMNAWQKAVQGVGSMVYISAEAGLGKSRLLEEIRKQTLAEPHYLVEGQCSDLHQNSSLYPIVQALQSWLRISREDSNTVKLHKIEAAADAHMLDRATIVPYLAELLSIQTPDFGTRNESAKQHKERLFEALLLLLLQNAEDQPMLFVVEDAHWMDPSSVELFTTLLQEIQGLPMLLVCTGRPEFRPPNDWTDRDCFIPIKLGPLSVPQARELIQAQADGKSLPPEIVRAIIGKTEGYPLFIEDLTRMVLESDMLELHGDAYRLARPIQDLAIPDTLQQTLMTRLMRVDSARLAAQLGALIDREFSYEMIKAIFPLDEGVLKESLGKLVSSGILYRRGLMSRAVYVFKHALIQDALYQSLLKRERKRYHQALAQLLEIRFPDMANSEPDLLARHFQEAGLLSKAARYWTRACENAVQGAANLEALSHAANALKCIAGMPAGEERDRLEFQIQTLQGPALLAVKGWSSPELGAACARARDLSAVLGEDEQRFRITRGLWTYHMVSAQLEESIRIADDLRQHAQDSGSQDYQIEAHAAYCDSYFWMGRLKECREHALAGLALYDPQAHHPAHALEFGEDPAAIFLCYGTLACWLLGHADEAEGLARQAHAYLDIFSHQFSRAFLLNGLAWYAAHLKDWAATGRYGQEMLQVSSNLDFPLWLALARVHCGLASSMQEKSSQGVAEIMAGIQALEQAAVVVTYPLCYYQLACAELALGRTDAARAAMRTGIQYGQNTEARYGLAQLYLLKQEVISHTPDAADTLRDVQQSFVETVAWQGAIALGSL